MGVGEGNLPEQLVKDRVGEVGILPTTKLKYNRHITPSVILVIYREQYIFFLLLTRYRYRYLQKYIKILSERSSLGSHNLGFKKSTDMGRSRNRIPYGAASNQIIFLLEEWQGFLCSIVKKKLHRNLRQVKSQTDT